MSRIQSDAVALANDEEPYARSMSDRLISFRFRTSFDPARRLTAAEARVLKASNALLRDEGGLWTGSGGSFVETVTRFFGVKK